MTQGNGKSLEFQTHWGFGILRAYPSAEARAWPPPVRGRQLGWSGWRNRVGQRGGASAECDRWGPPTSFGSANGPLFHLGRPRHPPRLAPASWSVRFDCVGWLVVRTPMGDDFVGLVKLWSRAGPHRLRFVQSKTVKKHPQMEARGLQHSPFTRFSPTAAPAKSTTCTIMVILITAHPPLPKLEHHRPPPRHLLQPQRKHGERERKREPSDGHRESGAAPPTRLRQPGYPRRRPHIGGGNPLPLSRRVRPEVPGNHPIFRTFSFSGLFPIPRFLAEQSRKMF